MANPKEFLEAFHKGLSESSKVLGLSLQWKVDLDLLYLSWKPSLFVPEHASLDIFGWNRWYNLTFRGHVGGRHAFLMDMLPLETLLNYYAFTFEETPDYRLSSLGFYHRNLRNKYRFLMEFSYMDSASNIFRMPFIYSPETGFKHLLDNSVANIKTGSQGYVYLDPENFSRILEDLSAGDNVSDVPSRARTYLPFLDLEYKHSLGIYMEYILLD